jgi:hypothetical protein
LQFNLLDAELLFDMLGAKLKFNQLCAEFQYDMLGDSATCSLWYAG